ncbi:MAG: glutamate 5-kinase, partial [Thermodesulfobacteriota bacterium]|nr:glutamate 5-kinase [Thermodesulfobacteriota bacterium]
IPVVNENDTVSVQELEFGDNDYLASLVVNLVQADLFVNLTSAKGVFDQNPDTNPEAKRLKCIEDISAIRLGEVCGGKTLDGTGGMYSKLLAARRAAQLGVPTLIISGRDAQCLSKAFSGQDVGTWIMPEGKKISRRKFRLAYNFEPAGSVIVDPGAANALTSRGKSLLPAGIQDVQGDFDAGALVRIMDSEGNAVGVGLSNYNAGDLRTIMGKHSAEIETALGRCPYPDAVHRDNMLLDAAV